MGAEVEVEMEVEDSVPVKEVDVASRFGAGVTEVGSLIGERVPGVVAPMLLAVSV